MAKKPEEKTEAQNPPDPQTGGRFVRNEDGTVTQVAGTTGERSRSADRAKAEEAAQRKEAAALAITPAPAPAPTPSAKKE